MSATPATSAFLDASVLYPALLRNLLMRLALHGTFQARWSPRVHDEWSKALLRNRPDLSWAQIARTRQLMDEHIQDASVTGYEYRIEDLELPDADDRHVLAAAIHCEACVIVTMNLRHFPAATLSAYGLEAAHPDAFIDGLIKTNPIGVQAATKRLLASFQNPPTTFERLLAEMRRQDLALTAGALAGMMDHL